MPGRTVVFSVIHPAVLPYVDEWAASVGRQDDKDFDLCLVLDGVSLDRVPDVCELRRAMRVICAASTATPATLRVEAWSELVSEYDFIVMVDADDVLESSRVAAAKRELGVCDVSACAVRLIDSEGQDLHRAFGRLPVGRDEDIGGILPRANIFGLSNTAYRSATLGACLSVPPECIAVDWYIATRAWTLGAVLRLDPCVRMAYRQHPDNMATILPPFAADTVRTATAIVLAHYAVVLSSMTALDAARRAKIAAAQESASRFREVVCGDDGSLEEYVRALNELPPPQAWWTIVAHPDLESLWT